MRNTVRSSNGLAELRRRAEELLAAHAGSPPMPSPEEVRELVHEFEVHRTELDMQNDQLRETQQALEASRNRYRGLFEHAAGGLRRPRQPRPDRRHQLQRREHAGRRAVAIDRSAVCRLRCRRAPRRILPPLSGMPASRRGDGRRRDPGTRTAALPRAASKHSCRRGPWQQHGMPDGDHRPHGPPAIRGSPPAEPTRDRASTGRDREHLQHGAGGAVRVRRCVPLRANQPPDGRDAWRARRPAHRADAAGRRAGSGRPVRAGLAAGAGQRPAGRRRHG